MGTKSLETRRSVVVDDLGVVSPLPDWQTPGGSHASFITIFETRDTTAVRDSRFSAISSLQVERMKKRKRLTIYLIAATGERQVERTYQRPPNAMHDIEMMQNDI